MPAKPTATKSVEIPENPHRLAERLVHPWAWWLWALSCATAVSLVTNPWLTLFMAIAVIFTMFSRRTDAPWAMSLKFYLFMALLIVGIRVTFAILFGGGMTGTILFSLPEIPLPAWMAGIRIGGDVVLEQLVYTVFDALRIGLMLLCVGAANTLANPRQALRSVPGALYELSVAVVVALSVAPQLIESSLRVRRARVLRGNPEKGIKGFVSLVIPVMQDAVDRSLSLAESMEVRGFGRTQRNQSGKLTPIVLVGSMMLLMLGTFLVLGTGSGTPRVAGGWSLALGFVGAIIGIRLSSRRLGVSRYRPLPWGAPEWLVTACGLGAIALSLVLLNVIPEVMTWSIWISIKPVFDPGIIAIAVLAAIPGFATPKPANNPPVFKKAAR